MTKDKKYNDANIDDNPQSDFDQESDYDQQPENISDDQSEEMEATDEQTSMKYRKLTGDGLSRFKLTGMYRDWFLDYASYVILERAVPHIDDGLKPVQRRILHSMRRLEDGRYNKVANIVGSTMQYHPHGDASIGDALVQLGQKNLLIDCQGNWGNILTGDPSAAPRYIEARLSKLALDVVFNPKTTEWMLSYDGRNQEPVTLPVKFPLLLMQGVEGIAVGLASKILPHNFNELIDASIAHLRGEDFVLLPDFPTGGLIDCTRYNDGLQGGVIKVRAKISKIDKRTLAITEIPFSTTTELIKDSIIKANEKGKIKIKKVDDNTAEKVEIIVHVSSDESTDKTIDALYATTLCEVSIWPNSCVICDRKPHFMGIKEILRHSAERTRFLLGRELEIRLGELDDAWHAASLERIFILNKIYQAIENRSREEAYTEIDRRLEPFKKLLRRAVTQDDIVRLTELRFIRISKYDSSKADNEIRNIEQEEQQVRYDIDHLTDYAVAYYQRIKQKYGAERTRRSEIREFDSIEAAKVVVANSKLYVDRAGGFFGIGNQMKKEELVCDCSDIDDIIAFTAQGKYVITKVQDKTFFAPNIIYIGVFKRNDQRTIYNVLYRDGDKGAIMMKRCAITSITRDSVYDITKGTAGSKILYMSVNPNGEAEVLKIIFKQRVRLKKPIVDLDFSTLAIKGRQSQGNLFSRYAIHRISVKDKGASTLGGQNIWYEEEIQRLNTDGRGQLLGEFSGDDKIIVFDSKNRYYTTSYDLSHHFPEETAKVEKYSAERIYSVVYYDAEQKFFYIKRFAAELSDDRPQPFIDENPDSHFVCISDDRYPVLEITYGGQHATRPQEQIDVAQFIGIKSHRAKGKRITTYTVEELRFVEPLDQEPEPTPDDSATETGDEMEMPQEYVEAEETLEAEAALEAEDDAQSAHVQSDAAPVDKPIAEKAETAEQKVVEHKTVEHKTVEHKATEQKTVEHKTAEPNRVSQTTIDEEFADVEFTVERPTEDDTRNPDMQQLNLF